MSLYHAKNSSVKNTVLNETSIPSTDFFPTATPNKNSSLQNSDEKSVGGESIASKINGKDKSYDWQAQRYKKALQRSREVKQHHQQQQRKSVVPSQSIAVHTPTSSISHSQYYETKEKAAVSLDRVIIDTSIMDSNKGKSPKQQQANDGSTAKRIIHSPSSVTTAAKDTNTSLSASEDMRRVLSTISINSPPRNHTTAKKVEKKKSPKKALPSPSIMPPTQKKISSIDVLDYLVEEIDSDPSSNPSLTSHSDVDSNRHFHSLAKKIHDKMILDGLSRGNIQQGKLSSSSSSSSETCISKKSNPTTTHPSIENSLIQEDCIPDGLPITPEAQFFLDLKREVSQDHKELWKKFQCVFGRQDESSQTKLIPNEQQSSSDKYRLNTSSQSQLRAIHDFLTTRYPSDNFALDSQLVSDKRLRKEQVPKVYVPSVNTAEANSALLKIRESSPRLGKALDEKSPSLSQVGVPTKQAEVNDSSQDNVSIKTSNSNLILKSDKSDRSHVLPKLMPYENDVIKTTQLTPKHTVDSLNKLAISFSLPPDYMLSTKRTLSKPASPATNNFSIESSMDIQHQQNTVTLKESNKATTTNDTRNSQQTTAKVNLRPPLPPSNLSMKADRVGNPSSKRLSWLSSLREKQKKHGRRPLLCDDDAQKDDETASVTTNDLEQYSIQKVGIDNVIAIFGTRASPSRLPQLDETFSNMGSPSTKNLSRTETPFHLKEGNGNMFTPKASSVIKTFKNKNASPVISTPVHEPSIVEPLKISILPHPLCYGDVIDLSNLPRKFFQPDEHVVKLPLSIKDGRSQFVVLGNETILTACSFPSNGNSTTKSKNSANIQWCAYRSQVQSITLSNDATVAIISLIDNSTCQVSFDKASDCMMFMKEFYSVSSSADIDSHNESFMTAEDSEIDESGHARGSPKPKREQKADVTTSTTLSVSTSLQVNSAGNSASILVNGNPLTDDELKVLEHYRKSHSSSAKTFIPETRTSVHEDDGKVILINLDVSSTDKSLLASVPTSGPILSQPKADLATEYPATDSLLTDDEELIATKYRKMLQFSIPIEAVAHKMKVDQVAKNIVSTVLSSFSSVVKSENAPTQLLDDSSKPSSTAELKPSVETYENMLKAGLPLDVVRHRMINDNLSVSVQDQVLSNCEKGKCEGDRLELNTEQEGLVSFYNRMLKMGVPKESVRHKMIMENVDEQVVSTVLKEKISSKNVKGVPLPKKSNLVSLHWTPLEEDKFNNSIWNFSTKKRKRSTIGFMPESQDMSRLEELFQKKNNSRITSIKVSSDDDQHSSHTKIMAKIIDIARAQNVAISLKAFREFSFDELIDIIRNLDASNKIQGERVQFMKDFLPTQKEEQAIFAFTGSESQLQPVEIFFRKLSSVPRATAKVAIIQAMANFNQLVEDVLERFNLLYNVCTQIINSEKLQLILEAILTIGNIMNQGTQTGDAVGFKFESLLKLTDTKSVDGSLTVLDYIVATFIEKRQRIVLDLMSDFPDCQVASRIAITDIVSDVASLGKGLKECKTELLRMKDELLTGSKSKETIKSGCNADKVEKQNLDPRQAMLASILARNKAITEEAAIDQNTETSNGLNADSKPEVKHEIATETAIKSSPGLQRLEDFVRVSSEKMENVEKIRNRTIQTCKELAIYCGESGGERVATTILTILSEFISNLQASIIKYDQKKELDVKKKDIPITTKNGSHVDSNGKPISTSRKDKVLSPRQSMLKEIVSTVQSKNLSKPHATLKSVSSSHTELGSSKVPSEESAMTHEDSAASSISSKSFSRQDLLRSIVDKAVFKKRS